jgi:hypothetical protein
MVNDSMVNGQVSSVFLVKVSENLLFLGRFIGVKNPIKYICNFSLNGALVHFVPASAAR